MFDKREDDDEGIWFGEEDDEGSPFRRRVELLEACSRHEFRYPKIFSELGFVYVDDGCDQEGDGEFRALRRHSGGSLSSTVSSRHTARV